MVRKALGLAEVLEDEADDVEHRGVLVVTEKLHRVAPEARVLAAQAELKEARRLQRQQLPHDGAVMVIHGKRTLDARVDETPRKFSDLRRGRRQG